MAGIMGLFASELDEFVADYDNQFWDASFHGETYPPRIIMERSTPPLYRVEDDGSKTLEQSFKVDKDLIGGFTINVDGQVLDASVKNELSKLRLKLLS